MSFDISAVVSALGEEAIAKAGEPVGLEKEQSVRVAHALAANAGLGDEAMKKKVAEDTGLDEEVVAAMFKQLIETGKEKALEETGVTAAIDNAKDEAMAALSNVGGDAAKQAGGFLKGLFGRK